jgi:DNA polymerase Ligase (LigD)
MPRFVLLYHDCPPNYMRTSHWDFMLESGGVLRTWALERLPRNWQVAHFRTAVAYPNCALVSPDDTVAALQLSDHRLDYLELEGPMSGDRGTVRRVAAGTYRVEHEAPGDWRLVLASDNLAASVRLSRPETENERWILSCS